MEHEKLKNSPIVEAVCEFRLSRDAAWDWTFPGMLYDHIKADYPTREEVVGQVYTFGKGPTVDDVPGVPERVQMKTLDGSSMIQSGPRLLAVNQLAPYPGWPDFKSRITKALTKHKDACGWQPIQRIGLLYINRVESAFGAEQVLTIHPRTDNLPKSLELTTFLQRWEFSFDDSGLVLTSTKISDPTPGFAVQLDAFSRSVKWLANPASIEDWLEQAHEMAYQVFESSLSPVVFDRLKG